MEGIITLSCPNCGGKLEIAEGLDRFACAHRGVEHIVERRGGTISLDPVMGRLDEIKEGSDKTASELAIQRIKQEIEGIEDAMKGVEVPPKSSVTNARIYAYLAGALGTLVFVAGLLAGLSPGVESNPGSFARALLFGGVIAGVGAYNYRSKQEQYDKAFIRMTILRKERNTKLKELEHHRKTVQIKP
jgi:hypothetical protein